MQNNALTECLKVLDRDWDLLGRPCAKSVARDKTGQDQLHTVIDVEGVPDSARRHDKTTKFMPRKVP